MLLRGCLLMNTEWVLGLVVTTGVETKINYGSSRSQSTKRGFVARQVNVFVVYEILLCFLMCALGAGLSQTSYGQGPGGPWYILDPPAVAAAAAGDASGVARRPRRPVARRATR